ncbi:MAG: PQQ-like beta-propeller repeat protein [Sedimentisphaerales bacterium]|nr:PQQ-like beta-propeller repeat protein [Sedimentisphaerales bacterium]
MTKSGTGLIIAVLTSLLISSNAYAASGQEYWPNWRGPDNTGAAKNANPPIKWSETENIKWKVEVPGAGLSTPIVWENKIIFLTAIETDVKSTPAAAPAADTQARGGRGGRGGGMSSSPANEYKFDIVCLDRETGKTIWQKTAIQTLPHEGHQQTGSFASSSAVTDGKRIWAGFGSRGVYCYDMDGNQIWKKDLGKMRMLMGFGEGSSVALAGDAIIVQMDQEDQSVIYALNKESGEILWQKNRDEPTSWATPLVVEVDGKLQVVTSATNFVRCYDVKTGDVIWQCSGQTRNVIPSPVRYLNTVICTSGYSGNKIQAIELGRTGDLSGTDAIKWESSSRTTPYVPSPLLYGERFYVLANNRAILSCYNAKTGKPYYESQAIEGAGGYYASPAGAADRVYLASQNGLTAVIKNSDTYEVLAANKLDDQFDASPAFVDNQIILKGHKYIYCIAEK